MSARVLVIDDDVEVCELLAKVLARAGHTVVTAGSGEEGLPHLVPGAVDCLVVDKQLPRMQGFEVIAEARRRIPGLPVVLVTAHPEPFSLGAERPDALLLKPFKSLGAIEDAVAGALEVGATQSPLKELRARLTQVVADLAPQRKRRP